MMPIYARDHPVAGMVRNGQEGIASREIRMNTSVRERHFIHSSENAN